LEVTEFIGVARILKVPLVELSEEDPTHYVARDFTTVLNDLLQNYELSSRTRRRELLELVRAAAHKEVP